MMIKIIIVNYFDKNMYSKQLKLFINDYKQIVVIFT